jgi:hypothetical protein
MADDDLPRRRARILMALGPSVFLVGLVWAIIRLALTDPSLALRSLAFAPPHQMMVVGILVAMVCVPLAAEVRNAAPEELSLPGFAEPEPEEPERRERPRGQRRRRSYHGYN